MYKNYDEKKMLELKERMEKENITEIQSFSFPYVTGEGKEERECNCSLEYDALLDAFTLIDLEADEILQDDCDLVIDNELLDDLIVQLKLVILKKRMEEIPYKKLEEAYESLQDTILVEFNAKIENDTIVLFSRTIVRDEEDFETDEFVHQTEIALDAIEVPLRYLTNAGFSLTQVEYILLSLSQYQGLPIKVTFGNNLLLSIG